jgi:hypothetical protein
MNQAEPGRARDRSVKSIFAKNGSTAENAPTKLQHESSNSSTLERAIAPKKEGPRAECAICPKREQRIARIGLDIPMGQRLVPRLPPS